MMLVVQLELTIEGKTIPQKYIKDFKIKLSRITRPQTLDLSLVRKAFNKNPELFGEDKEIELKACYKNRYELTPLFKGFITEFTPSNTYVSLKCEDYSHKLKKVVNIAYKQTYDGNIFKQLVPLDTSNVQNRKYFTKVSFRYMSVNRILEYSAERSNSDWFFINDKLYYGEKYSFNEQKEIMEVDLDSPLVVKKDNLKWHEGVKDLKVVVIAKDEKGKVYTGKAGSGSKKREFEEPGMSKGQVQDKAKELYKELTFRGYRGSIKLFAEPIVYHSEKIKITDGTIEREAYIDAVEFSFSLSGGLRMELFVGQEEKEKKKPKKLKKRGNRKGKRGNKKKKQSLGYQITREQERLKKLNGK